VSDSEPPKFDPRDLQKLLDATLPPDEETSLLEILKHNPVGCQMLEDMAADQEFRNDVREYLRSPAPVDPSVVQILSGLGDWLSGTERSSFDFLEPSDDDESIGRFDGYRILSCIGRGGMGIVFKAVDPVLNRTVALKVLSPQLASHPNARARFLREARAAAAVNHDHVVIIHAVSESAGLPYLVMEFVCAVTLQDLINATSPLQLTEVLRIGSQVASGLAAAHAQGLVHRDIKPGNILLETDSQRVTITDFGLARTADDGSVTCAGMIVGTPEYMSPEQAYGNSLDARSDLFSLGSVLQAMCTGQSPFRCGSLSATLHRVCQGLSQPIRELNPHVPDWLVAVIAKLHAKDPENRFQSATEVAELLTQYLAVVQRDGAATSLPSAASGWWRWSIGFVVIALLAASLLFYNRTGPQMRMQPQLPSATPAVDLELVTDKPKPAVASSITPAEGSRNLERAAAEWVLSQGGYVTLYEFDTVRQLADLPTGDFRIQAVNGLYRGARDEDLSRFRGLSNVQGLELSGNPLSDDALLHIGEIPTLRWLYLGRAKITDRELHRLSRLQNLESLGLEHTSITDAGLLQIRGLERLRELLLANTQVTDRTLQHFASFPTLVRLNLYGTAITDDGLKHLQGMRNLKFLILERTGVTDSGLEYLKALTSLRELNLRHTNVTHEGITTLEKYLPECQIENFPLR
jgi:eukaryotic-like serine/threonine-protein kinase